MFRKLFKRPYRFDYLKALYDNPDALIDIVFYNRTKITRELWVEPACEEIQLDPETEFKIVTHDKHLRFEYDELDRIILYLECSFGFKLYKRKYVAAVSNPFEWELIMDDSVIN